MLLVGRSDKDFHKKQVAVDKGLECVRVTGLPGSIRFNPIVSTLAALALWAFVLYAVLDDQSTTVFGEWKTYVTQKFTWLYILSQDSAAIMSSISWRVLGSYRRGCCVADQDYWIVFLVPLVYYYGEMKLGKDSVK